MKITKRQLKQIILEEKQKLDEAYESDSPTSNLNERLEPWQLGHIYELMTEEAIKAWDMGIRSPKEFINYLWNESGIDFDEFTKTDISKSARRAWRNEKAERAPVKRGRYSHRMGSGRFD